MPSSATAEPQHPPKPWLWPPGLRASLGLHAAAAGAALLLPGSAPWALAAVAANHLALSAAGLWPRSRLLGPNVTRLPAAAAARGEFALTLDDGPDPEVTPAVLDLLAAAGVRASFFVIAERAARHPALVRRLLAEGHEVQNHSLRHRHDFSLRGPAALRADIERAQAQLMDLGCPRPHAFRAPAGLRNPLLDPVLHRLDLHLVSWTRRGFDTREPEAARVLQRLIGAQGERLQAGDILLLHDGHARRGPSGRAVLLDVLPPLLAAARARGLRPTLLRAALPPRSACLTA